MATAATATPAICGFDSTGFAAAAVAAAVGDLLVPGAEGVDLGRELDEGVEVGGRRGGEPESKVIGVTVEVDENVKVGGGRGGEPDAKVIGVVVEKIVSLVSDGNEVVVDNDKVLVLGRREDEGVLDCEVIGD